MQDTLKKTLRGLLCGSTLVSVSLSSVHADASNAKTDQNTLGTVIEEVTVTVQRREEKAQEVPISASVFTGEFINQYLSNPTEVANFTPNFQFVGDGLTNSFATIRGLGASDTTQPIDDLNIITYHDNIATGSPFFSAMPMWDLGRIEVSRGPQGTLFGRNAVGGAVQYVSAAPTDDYEGYAELTVGEFDLRRFEGAASGPVTDKVKARLSALTYDRGGDVFNPRHNIEQGERNWWGVRGIIDWQIADDFDARLKVQRFKGDTDMFLWFIPTAEQMPANHRAWLEAAGLESGLERSSKFERREGSLQDPFETVDIDTVEVDLNYNFGTVMLTGILGYMNGENLTLLDTTNTAIEQLFFNSSEQWSGELRLTSQTDHPFQWIAGAYYQRNDDLMHAVLDQTGSARDLDGDRRTRYNADSQEDLLDGVNPSLAFSNIVFEGGNARELETSAFFLHTTFEWTDQFTTTHAVRYTHEDQIMDYRFASLFEIPVSFGVTPGVLGAMHRDLVAFFNLSPQQQRQQAVSIIRDRNTLDAAGNVVPFRRSQSAEDTTWRLAADYRLTDDMLLYSSISRGFKGGKFSAFVADANSAIGVGPETAIVYEAGIKSEWLDNRLQANFSMFYDDHRGYQTILFNPEGILGAGAFLLDSIPESELYGAELEIKAVPLENLFVAANFGVLETKITKVPPGNDQFLGNELPLAEDMNFSGLLRYDVPTDIGTFSPQISGRYRGGYWSLKENNDYLMGQLGDFWTLDGRIGYRSVSGGLYGMLYVKNALNEIRPMRTTSPLTGNSTRINERRNWGIQVGYRF